MTLNRKMQMRPSPAVNFARDRFAEHLELIKSELPENLQAIAPAYFVDDALVAQVRANVGDRSLKLTLRCGNIPNGYFDLVLRYEGVDYSEGLLAQVERIALRTRTRLRYAYDAWCHEICVLAGTIVHSIVFHFHPWPREDNNDPAHLVIRCAEMSAKCFEKPDRTLPRIARRFSAL